MSKRRTVRMTEEGRGFAARFWHPIKQQTVRVALGPDPADAKDAVDKLNALLQNEATWHSPPDGTPDCVLTAWGVTGDNAPTHEHKVKHVWLPPDHPDAAPIEPLTKEQLEVAVDDPEARALEDALVAVPVREIKLRRKMRALAAENALLRQRLKQYERRTRIGVAPSLEDAKGTFLKKYPAWDKDYAAMVGYDLARFVAKFGEATPTSEMENKEDEIKTWLTGLTVVDIRKDEKGQPYEGPRHGQPLGADRRNAMRRHVLKFLSESGVYVSRKEVATARNKQRAIRWLERDQAEAVASLLPAYYSDLFRVQVAMGLRPDELITIKKGDVTPDYSRLILSPHEHLTLKKGSRTVTVPKQVREIFERRLAANEFAFPNPATGKPWLDPKWYNRQYGAALKAAGKAAGVGWGLDCRTGRRTCASLLIRAGMSVENVAAVLGNTPVVIRDHYARILSHESDPSAAALASEITPAKKKRKPATHRKVKKPRATHPRA